jgi:single-strand DNA-binding protein
MKGVVVSVNKVILIGRLGKHPEVKYAASGSPVCTFSLATNEKWKDKAGNAQEHTEWHVIVAFGKLAEICGQYLTAGRQCLIEGSIRSNKYEDREGVQRTSYKIVARQMQMLSPSSNGNGAKAKNSAPTHSAPTDESDNPFREDEAMESDVPF